MYLKSLTLKGFKSFADRSRLVFEPGMTAIVGPNGSGKSNVSDAVLWVLGEQSARLLRGSAMEDVVFAGSAGRKPAGLAEVELSLDNSDGTLPVDFTEVVITRRMYRSGESEYLVNGSPARLADVTDILHDSGLGKGARSIIGQGKIDQILTGKPEERRALIEEAAGISKHKRRRERAERRLASMDEGLRRAQDVQREVMRRLRPLERQAEKARRHAEAEGRARELRAVLAVDDLRALQARWGSLDEAGRAADEELGRAAAALKEAQEAAARLEEARSEARGVAAEAEGRLRRCERSAERLSSCASLLDEKAASLDARRREAAGSLERAREREAALAEEARAARSQGQEADARIAELQQGLAAANEAVRAAKAARREADDAARAAQERHRALQRDRDAASVALAKARDALAGAREQERALSARREELEASAGAGESAAEEARSRHGALLGELERARAEEAEAARALEEAQAATARARAAEQEARRALGSAEALADGLSRAAEAGENAAPLAARVAAEAPEGLVAARVGDVLEVPEGLSALVEGVLGEALAGFVAPDPPAASRLAALAARLAADAEGRVEVVVASGAPACQDAPEGAPGEPLLGLVAPRAGLEGAARALLGNVRLVGSAEEALAASASDPARVYVAPDGTTATGGCRARAGRWGGASAGVIETRRRLREARAALPGLRAALDSAASEASEATAREAEASRLRKEASGRAAGLAGEEAQARAEAGRRQREASSARAELEQAEARLAEARSRAKESEGLSAEHERAAARAEEGMGAAAREESAARQALGAAQAKERAARDSAGSCQVELARAQERAASLLAASRRAERDLQDAGREREGLEASERECAARSGRAEAARSRARALADAARDLEGGLRESASRASGEAGSLEGRLAEARARADAAASAREAAMARASELKVEKGRLEAEVEASVKALASQPGVDLDQALLLPAPADRAADERELAALEKELAGMGPVNEVALSEYEPLKARADYLSAQVDDLKRARADISRILAAIDRKMRRSFMGAFDEVGRSFSELFAVLFPGGSGRLELCDPDDPDASGVEVVAQPRGKRVTKMSLLSGGERSLTALCLLFAAYRTRGVPFFILDEVEAALDDTNLDRLLGALSELRKSTQLIVITHQRRTMEQADVLYGVSMQADGVSRVVSQRLGGRGAGGA